MSLDDPPHRTVELTDSLAAVSTLPLPEFAHLKSLTTDIGLWEHARLTTPRQEHGYCTDDNARGLIVVSRQPSNEDLVDLAAIYLRFVLDARTASGGFHNRRSAEGLWVDEIGSDDSQGRAWWALGTAARAAPREWMRQAGRDAFESCESFDSPHLRANAYSALGAVEMLAAQPGHAGATRLLARTAGVILDSTRGQIPWPETRLTYANARLPEALLAAGATLADTTIGSTGTRLLEWLVGVESRGDHFSYTAANGWAPGEPRPAFDQQAIETWAMADACHRAWSVTGAPVWREHAIGAAQWLMGRNDNGAVLYDPATGGTCDGLTERGVNHNRGAESTLAGIASLQIAARYRPVNSQTTKV